jgi:hypothetical protein
MPVRHALIPNLHTFISLVVMEFEHGQKTVAFITSHKAYLTALPAQIDVPLDFIGNR